MTAAQRIRHWLYDRSMERDELVTRIGWCQTDIEIEQGWTLYREFFSYDDPPVTPMEYLSEFGKIARAIIDKVKYKI